MKIFFSVRGTPWDKKCEFAKIKFKLKHFLSSMMEMFVFFFFFKKEGIHFTANRVLIPLQSNRTAPFDFTTSDVTRVVTSKGIKELFDDTTDMI